MQTKIILNTLACAAVMALMPSQARAYDVVNTQSASNSVIGANTIDSSNWLAERFTVTTATQIDSVLAYVLSDNSANDLGKTFTMALYGQAGGLPDLNWNADQQGQLFQSTVTYSGDGWNGLSNLNWSIGAGSYWLAIEQYGGSNDMSALLLPSGAQPTAQAVAFYTGGQHYAATGLGDTFGLHITAVTPAVPEPSSMSLLLVSLGLMGVVSAGRRRS